MTEGDKPDAVSLQHSRALLLAGLSSELSQSELSLRMNSAVVVVSIEHEMFGAALCARTLLTTLRRMPCRLVLDPTGLPDEIVRSLPEQVQAIDPDRSIDVANAGAAVDCRLHVGRARMPTAITLVPEGHGGHVVRHGALPRTRWRKPSPLGSIFTAALGANEAFKSLARVRSERRSDPDHVAFCPVSLTDELDRAPELPLEIDLNVALVGLGAVGTGHALILSELPWHGRVALVDAEHFDVENVGTYSIGGSADAFVKPWKVDLVAPHLARYQTSIFQCGVSEYITAIDKQEADWPSFVLSGLDSVDARHETQRLWPDHLIDAATGETAVGLHHVRVSEPCLRCSLPKATGARYSMEELANKTGLPIETLRRGDEPLREEDLQGLTTEQKDALAAFIGTPKCGLAQAFGISELDSTGFRPSIPFVSLQAACLGVGRLISVLAGSEPTSNFFQYDSLFGPQGASAELRAANPNCYCSERRSTINRVRNERKRLA